MRHPGIEPGIHLSSQASCSTMMDCRVKPAMTLGPSIPVGNRQLFRREQRNHAAALVRDHDLLLDAGGGVAVSGGAIGLEREHHALLDLGRMVERDHARNDW